jgi:hypothetical protein
MFLGSAHQTPDHAPRKQIAVEPHSPDIRLLISRTKLKLELSWIKAPNGVRGPAQANWLMPQIETISRALSAGTFVCGQHFARQHIQTLAP